MHGACRDADITCAALAETLRFGGRAYPADWEKHGRSAGPIHNRQMLSEENKPEEPIDLVLAFHNNIQKSRWTADMLDCINVAGLPWKLCTSSDDAKKLGHKSNTTPGENT